MARRIEFKGKTKTIVGIAGLLIAAWLVFGQTLFTFNFGYFSRGYQVSFFRDGHFETRGEYWNQQNRRLGRVISLGDEALAVDLDAEISRGTLVLFAWRWPAFLFDEHMITRVRSSDDTREHLRIPLPDPGLYVLSISGINLRGDITVDWSVVPF